jgi:hypothetical protein
MLIGKSHIVIDDRHVVPDNTTTYKIITTDIASVSNGIIMALRSFNNTHKTMAKNDGVKNANAPSTVSSLMLIPSSIYYPSDDIFSPFSFFSMLLSVCRSLWR